MSVKTDYQSPVITIASLPEDDPNATPPLDDGTANSRVYDLSARRTEHAGDVATGLKFYLVFTGDNAATVTVETWTEDERDSSWALARSQTLVGHREWFEVLGTGAAKCFLRLTTPSGSATSVVIRKETQVAQ